MTQKEIQLLLKDLSARLSCGVKVDHFGTVKELLGIIPFSENVMVGYDINDYEDSVIEDIKPYLRPLSSMTEEEKLEFEELGWRVDELEENKPWAYRSELEYVVSGIDWLLKKHFDYRGLIEKGLALEASEGMYEI